MGAINDANNASFEKNKVHNWIKSSQKYFPDSSHEGDSEPPEAEDAADLYAGALTENKTRTSPAYAKRSHTKKSQLRRSLDGNEGQQEKANHENEENMKSLTSDTVKMALQGFVDDEKSLLNKMKPRTVQIAKPTSMGRLSASTQELANNSDAVEAVFSALHKTRDEVTKTLTDEVKRSEPLPMKVRQKPQPAADEVPNRDANERKDVFDSASKRKHHNSSYEDDRDFKQAEPVLEEQRSLPEATSKSQSHQHGYESGELESTVGEEVADEIVHLNSRSRQRHRDDLHAERSRAASQRADEEEQYQLQRRSHDNVEKSRHKRRSDGGRKSKGRHRRHVDEERWSATHEKLNGISDYTYALSKGLEKDAYRKGIDKMVKQNRKGMIRSLNSLCKGEPFDFSEALLDEDFNHFDGLSLGTQLESSFTPESNMVKRAHYDVLKEWLTKKPLDSYLVGKYDISDLNIDEIKPSLKIDQTVRECLSEFSDSVFELMKGDNEPVQHLNVFPKPRNDTEETVDKVFRQVHQYMDFVVSQAEHSNRHETHVNGYTTPVTADEDMDRLSPEPQEVHHDRPGSASSSDGVDNNELSDEGRGRKKSRHKHKKKKRKHKKSSKSPDKRRKQRFVDYPTTDEESDASEPPTSKRKFSDTPEKDCYKPANTPAKKKTTTGAPPKGVREQGMTHIMEEFYGDVESLLNNSDVSLDGIPQADQHLPPLQGLRSENVKDPHVDTMIKEEMTKTKQHLLNIMPDLTSKKNSSATSIGNITAGIPSHPRTNSSVDTVNCTQEVNSTASRFRTQNYLPRQETAFTENSVGRRKTRSNSESYADKHSNVPPSPERERLPPREEEPRRLAQTKRALSNEGPRKEYEESSVPPWRRHSAEKNERSVSQSTRSSHARAPERHISRSISPSHRKSIKRKYSPPPRQYSDHPYRLKKHTKPPVDPEPEAPAPKVDTTYVDSFSSKLVDPYGETPVPNFEPFFDVTKPPQGHFANPFNHWWSIMQYFLDESRADCDMKYLEKCVPGWSKRSTSGVLPENSFLLALSFATGKMPRIDSVDKKIATDDALEFADVGGDMNEYGSAVGANDGSSVTRTRTISVNSSGSTENNSVGDPSNGDDKAKAAASKLPKRVNTLALAFRQAVEAKKAAQNGSSATTVKIPLLRKMKTRPIRTRLKSTPPKPDAKPQPKTPDPSTSKDVRPIPYGEEEMAGVVPAVASPKKVPLNTYFEPELNSRIHSVMEEAMHDFVSNLKSSVKNSLGQLSWNQTTLPSSFYHPPNQVRHLMALSGQAQRLFDKLRDDNKSRWTFSKTNVAVQTDCSKIPARKNSSAEKPAILNPVPVVDVPPKEKSEEPSQITAPVSAIQEGDAIPVGEMYKGIMLPVVKKPTAQIPATRLPAAQTPVAQTPAAQTPAVQTPEVPLSIQAPDSSEVDMDISNSPDATTDSKVFFSNPVASVSTASPYTVPQVSIPLATTEPSVQTTSLSTTPAMVTPAPTAVVAPALPTPTASPSQRPPQVKESRFSAETFSPSSDSPASKPQAVAAPVARDPSPPMVQMASNKNVSDHAISSAEPPPVTDGSQQSTYYSHSQAPIVTTNSEAPSMTVVTTETAASGSFTQIAPVSSPSEPVKSLAPVKFSLFKSSPSLSQKPATFIPVAKTTAPLPFVELPPITAEALAPIPAVSASSVSNEPVTSVSEPPVPAKSDTPATRSAGESVPAVASPVAAPSSSVATAVAAPTFSVAAASTVTTTTSSSVDVPVVEAEEKPQTTEVNSYMQTPGLGLVSFDHVEIPGFGAPEEAAPPPVTETPAVSEPPAQAVATTPSRAATITSSSPAVISAPPVLSTPITTSNLTEIPTTKVPAAAATSFSLDAIPLPPAGKTSESPSSSKSSKWQEWKKQKEEEWRKQAEVVQDVGELTQWPPPDWRKQVEPAPPVSTLTEWPPKLATDNIPPPPLPPILQSEWSTPPAVDPAQQQQQPPPHQYQQGWYGPQYRPPWQGGWGPRGPPPPGWGGWHGGQWRQWGPRHHGPRGPWDRPPHPGYWEHPQHHGQHWGAGEQQQNNPQGEWGDGSYHQQANWYQPPPGWGAPPPHADPTQPPPGYPEAAPETPSHAPPPLPPDDEPVPPPGEDWQPAAPKPPQPPVAAPGEDVTKPVTLGTERSENPRPASNVRMFVFNQDQPICKSVQKFMNFLGAKSFDPYNVNTLQAIPSVETLVMVQLEDVPKINEVPNLLALKTQEWVKFVAYESVTEVQHKTYSVLLKAGGIAVPDDSILLSLQPESLGTICDYMLKQKREGRDPWYLMVHNHVVNKLQNAREDERMRQLHMILTRYEEEGVVRVMRSPTFDNTPLPPHEFLSLMIRLQAQYAFSTRHTVLLTDMPQSDVRTLPFLRQGVSVMNVSSFMRLIVGAPALPPLPQTKPYYGLKESDMFLDSYLSSGEDLLPPMLATNLMEVTQSESADADPDC